MQAKAVRFDTQLLRGRPGLARQALQAQSGDVNSLSVSRFVECEPPQENLADTVLHRRSLFQDTLFETSETIG